MPNLAARANADPHALILEAIEHKRRNGAPYASGKTLVVFIDSSGCAWFPNRVTRALPKPLYFAAVWAVSLQTVENGAYTYGVTMLDVSGDQNAPVYLVRINSDFERWEVTPIQ